MSDDYSQAHVLLPFVCHFIQSSSPYGVVRARLVRDGSLRFALTDDGPDPLELEWVEHARAPDLTAVQGEVVVRAMTGDDHEPSGPRQQRLQGAARHVARRLARLLTGDPPHLLRFRNRNPQSLQWDARLFQSLCPDMIVRTRTRYHDYRVTEIDEFEGSLNITFATRRTRVRLRLQLGLLAGDAPLMRWGPISMLLLQDERTEAQRADPEHRVEEFLGYVLSRNLPPRFALRFAHHDPPAGYLPPDHNIDFLRRTELDDTALFEMLLAADDELAVLFTCDRECFNLFSLVGGGRERWTTSAPWSLPPAPEHLARVRWLDLTTRATVMGEDFLDAALAAISDWQPPPRLVVSVDSCLAKLVGNDAQGPVERFARASGIPIVHYDIRLSQSPHQGPQIDFWRDVVTQITPSDSPPDPRAVAFLGLHPDGLDELTALLASVGVKSRGNLFPSLSIDTLRELRSAGAVVANAWSFVQLIFSGLLDTIALPVTQLALPYGLRGTCTWLERVAAAVGIDAGDRIDALPAVVEATAEWDRARRDLAGQRVGLFARAADVREQLSPRGRFGVDLLGLLAELGLAIDLHLFVSPEAEPPTADLLNELGLDPGRGDRLHLFYDFRELPDLLRRGEFGVVYTELYRDERISAHGKVALTLSDLEPGLAGAVRTARRLRALLRWPFHRRYQHHYESPWAHYLRSPLEDDDDR